MSIEQQLYQAATSIASNRYPKGWSGAAAIRLANGEILTSLAPEVLNEGLALCMEVGALLEAHRLNQQVTHSLCVSREDENSEFLLLSPCGICQERLVIWGKEVLVAITNPKNHIIFRRLGDLMPHHWSAVNDIES